MALGRISKKFYISKPISAYIFIIRGTPLLVQIYLIYFGLGSIKFIRESFLWILLKEPFWCGVFALTINTVAYGAEIFRGGIQAVTIGQVESGKSLGFSEGDITVDGETIITFGGVGRIIKNNG